jgi:hypothetical protein
MKTNRTNNKIQRELFCTDLQNKNTESIFEKLFETSIEELLSDYDEYDEIDEYPIEINDKGVMIGFLAETSKEPARIEYIDLDIESFPDNMDYLSVTLPVFFDAQIETALSSYENLRIYYSLYDIDKPEIIVFHHENLRYELLVTEKLSISRIRVCRSENESTIDMRTYYPFGEEYKLLP